MIYKVTRCTDKRLIGDRYTCNTEAELINVVEEKYHVTDQKVLEQGQIKLRGSNLLIVLEATEGE